MPDLNIKGDIIDNFGKHLPTPIIDYVSIRNDKLEVQVSLFFNFEDITLDNERIDEIIEHFQNDAMLYVTVAYVLGKTYSDALINKENVDIFSELYERSDTAAYLAQDEAKDIIPEYKNFKVAQFIVDGTDKWQQSNQNFYDKDDHKIIQFSQTFEIPVHFSGDLDFDIENINENIFLAPNNGLNDAFEGGLTVFAFSSWVDLDELSRSSFMPGADMFALKKTEISDDNREFQAAKIDLMPNLAKQLFSDISYEKVFSNGYAYIEPQVYFVDQEEIVYNKTPILAINGKYYKQDGYTLDAISETFQELIDSAKQLGAEDSQIQSILDNTSAMLQTHGEESELLAKLHLILLTFPEKSTATEVGRFYDRYKNRLFNVNEAAISGTPVEEKVMRTSKVRDLREVLATDWSKNTPQKPPVVYAGSPENVFPGGLVSALKIYEEPHQTGDPSTDPNIFVKNGFWFFDYERALRNYSNIAKIFDIDAITNYFGDGVLQSTFKLTTAKMIKHYFHELPMGDPDNRDLMAGPVREWYLAGTEIPGDYLTDLAKFETSIEYTSIQGHAYSRYTPISQTFTLTDYITTQSPAAFIFSRTEPYISFNGATDEIGYLSYLALRGAEPVDDPDVKDGYRMMVFEFQDVEEDHQEDDLNQVYSFSVECIDTTKSLALAIIEAYTSQVLDDGSLQQYYVYASEECNYNNIDKTFNEFFTEGVMSLYSGMEPHNYPWVYAPVMYNFNLDLISNAFGGDTQKIIDASRAITARINPTNGNLDDLDAFMTNYNKIIDEQYGPDNNSAPLRSAVDDLANELILSFGDPDDAHAAGGGAGGFRAQYYPMPYAVPITKEYVATSPGKDVYSQPVHDWGWKRLAETSLYGTDQWRGGEWWSTGGERELYYLRECMKKKASYVPDTYDEASFTGSGKWQGDTTTYSNGFGIKAWKEAVNGNTTFEDKEGEWDYASAWDDIEDWIADNDGKEGKVPSDGDGKTFYVQHHGAIEYNPPGHPTYIDNDGDVAYWRTSAKHYDDDCDGASSRKMKVQIDNDNKQVWLKYYEWRCDYEETDSSNSAYHPHGSQDRSI